MMASDGLLKYAKPIDIARLANGPDLVEASRALLKLVTLRRSDRGDRLGSGTVSDGHEGPWGRLFG